MAVVAATEAAAAPVVALAFLRGEAADRMVAKVERAAEAAAVMVVTEVVAEAAAVQQQRRCHGSGGGGRLGSKGNGGISRGCGDRGSGGNKGSGNKQRQRQQQRQRHQQRERGQQRERQQQQWHGDVYVEYLVYIFFTKSFPA